MKKTKKKKMKKIVGQILAADGISIHFGYAGADNVFSFDYSLCRTRVCEWFSFSWVGGNDNHWNRPGSSGLSDHAETIRRNHRFPVAIDRRSAFWGIGICAILS